MEGLESIAKEALNTFEEITQTARTRLESGSGVSTDSFAVSNTLTGARAHQNLSAIQQGVEEGLRSLVREPAIMRMVLEDDTGNLRVVYISRTSNIALPSGTDLASYRSPMGRFAEIPLGETEALEVKGQSTRYYVIEKFNFNPDRLDDQWDSKPSIFRHLDQATYTVTSLRDLLGPADSDDFADELERLLAASEEQEVVQEGIKHQVRTAMGLRDQPILDQFQGVIFRLPLDQQLIILGPPGTGKTTTLIKRLGQKLDLESLDADERRIAEAHSGTRPHQSSWLMFTPSELLKHYLKEAFSREQVPASNEHIRTWVSFRNDIARNTLGILRSANGGQLTLKSDLAQVHAEVTKDPRGWYEAFKDYHEARLRQQLVDGISIVTAAASESEQDVLQQLGTLTSTLESQPLIATYRVLDDAEDFFKRAVANAKSVADELLHKERNRLFNRDKEIFQNLAKYLETLQQDNDPDEEEVFDSDELEEQTPRRSSLQAAVDAYLSALRALARHKYLKRSISKTSRSGLVVKFLRDNIPTDDILMETGRHISFQNGLRRFINSHKRYVSEVSASYRNFRKDKKVQGKYYFGDLTTSAQVASIELDAIILMMLKNTRELLQQNFVTRGIKEAKFSYLQNVADLFRNQIMVDEATDFSLLELACMESLTAPISRSFFACGDFNQRITTTGIRQSTQLNWISPSLLIKPVQLVYRQSRKLNAFAGELLRMQKGDLSALGTVPEESNHEGVNPVLVEHSTKEEVARWIADRVKEVERSVQQLPTIAVLVNSESEVKPTAELLSNYLEDVNLTAVACEEGKALGEGTDVRVFDIQHIKGLEFEAVFFAGLDLLAEENPDLFDRYLYVGATRAATYLGAACYGSLPNKLEALRPAFDLDWGV